MLQQVMAVAIVLTVLGATLWLLRRRGVASWNGRLPRRAGKAKNMNVLERMPLTPHHSLHLVRVLDRTVLIGVSPSSCTQLADFPIQDAAKHSQEISFVPGEAS